MYYDSKYSVNVYLMRYVAFFSMIPGLVLRGNSGLHATSRVPESETNFILLGDLNHPASWE